MFRQAVLRDDKEARQIPRVENLVEQMIELNLEEDRSRVLTHDAGIVTDPPRTVSAKGRSRLPGEGDDKPNKTSSRTCAIL